MEEYSPTDRHWTLAPQLQAYLITAGWSSGALLTFGILANIFSWKEASLGIPLRIAGGLLGASGAVLAVFLWLSMLSFWWQIDRRRSGMSVSWLLALSVGNWVGATLYYFFIFRRICRGEAS